MLLHRLPPLRQRPIAAVDMGEITDSDSSESLELPQPWQKFEYQPPLPGFLANFIVVLKDRFVAPGQTNEAPLHDMKRSEEKNIAKEVCRYLLNNGVRSVRVTGNFPEYAKAVNTELLEDETIGQDQDAPANMKTLVGSLDVAVVLLRNCNGRWQQNRMWQLVADACTARLGVVIIGHEGITDVGSAPDELWNEFVNFLETCKEVGWKDHFQIICRRHSLVNRRIYTSRDFQIQSPYGGCANICGQMACGHYCSRPCHPIDPYHSTEEFRCVKPCKRKCKFGHSCNLVCWEDCSDKQCYKVITNDNLCEHNDFKERQIFCHHEYGSECQIPKLKHLPCGHSAMLSCSGDVRDYKCTDTFDVWRPCGHLVELQCGDDKIPPCEAQVVKTLPCGHQIEMVCNAIIPDYQLPRCERFCYQRLKCGHVCDRPCHGTDHEAIQCKFFCERMCASGVHECVKHLCKDPCPPCKMERDVMLHCGHFVKTVCSEPNPDLRDYVCYEVCRKPHLFCKHPCPKLCFEECGGCEFVVAKPVKGCPRGHTAEVKCCESSKAICDEIVLTSAECGHVIKVECGELSSSTTEELARFCNTFCGARFSEDEKKCGHRCSGDCWECYQGRFHRRCQQTCGKPLFCGHTCTTPCGFSCPPCRYPCFNRCEHKKCEFECGVPCDRNCELPCEYKCEHSSCTKLCHEVCNKPICNEPCTKILPCNHPCVGFCGEICPPYCRLCDKDKLLEGLLGGSADLNPNDRFIYLSDCDHCVESSDMEAWLNVQSNGKEILSFACPICGLRMQWIRRYSGWMDRNFKLVNKIRAKVFGNIEEIKAIIQEAKNVVEEHEESTGEQPCFQKFAEYLQLEFKRSIAAAPEVLDDETRLPISLNKNVAKFLLWLANEWVYGSSLLINMRPKLTLPFFNNFSISWQNYFDMITERACWPMHPNEMEDTRRERKRLDDLTALYTIMAHSPKPEESPLLGNMEAMRVFRIVETVLRQPRPYTARMQENIANNLKDLSGMISVTLSITETERLQILDAFNLSSGRWFKCANGHIYVVTECGGATEEGVCPECGQKIGGTNHLLAEDNYLATEMDGATIPIYPNTLYRNY